MPNSHLFHGEVFIDNVFTAVSLSNLRVCALRGAAFHAWRIWRNGDTYAPHGIKHPTVNIWYPVLDGKVVQDESCLSIVEAANQNVGSAQYSLLSFQYVL